MRWLPLIAAFSLVAASCSDGGPTSEPDPSGLAAELAASVPVDSPTSTTTLRPPVPTDPPEPDAPMVGDMVNPCGSKTDNRIKERPGVGERTVTIGTGSDRGGLATPGSGDGIIDMIEALADFCNAAGGILGREVAIIDYDAAGVEAAERVAEACDETVALVGHAFLQFVVSEFAAASCGLPTYPNGAGLLPTTPFALHGHLAALFIDPETAGNVVLVGPDTPGQSEARDRRASAIAQGAPLMRVVGEVAYPVDVAPDWSRIVGQARALGAGQVHVVGGCEQVVLPFAEIAESAGWRPVMLATAAAYDSACLGSPQADRLLIELPFLPFEDGDLAPSAAEHLDLLERIGAEPTGNGLLAASAFWLWASQAPACLAQGAPSCPGEPVVGVTGWTGTGIHPAIDATTPACAVVVGVGASGFERRLPIEPGTYDCLPDRSVTVGDGVQEADVSAATGTAG